MSDTQFPNDGKPVTLQVGSSRDVHIIYTFAAGNEIIEKGAIDCDNELFNRKLTYKPEYGNGLTFCYAWMRDGKTYTNSIQIKRPLPDKTLKMRWETFRDRLTPGQQEEWTLKIEAPSSNLSPLTSNLSPLTSRSARSDALLAKNLSHEPVETRKLDIFGSVDLAFCGPTAELLCANHDRSSCHV